MASTIMQLPRYSSLQQCWRTFHRMSVWNLRSKRLLCTNYTVSGPTRRIQMVPETHKNNFKSSMVVDRLPNVIVREFSSGVDGEINQYGRGEKASARDEEQVFDDSWSENMELLRKNVNLTEKESLKLVEKSPRLRQTEKLVHLLDAVAIMKDIGYDNLTLKRIVNGWATLLLHVSLESLNSVFKDQREFILKNERYDHIFKQVRLSTNTKLEERELFRMSMDKKYLRGHGMYLQYRHVVFPLKKLMVDNMPYQSFGEYVSSRLGVEQRVVDSILCLKSQNPKFDESLNTQGWTTVYNVAERISILLDFGVSKHDILENNHLLRLQRYLPFYNISVFSNVVKKQKHLSGKVDLKNVTKYFLPRSRDNIRVTLGRLLQISMSSSNIPKKLKLYLQDKSQVNAVRVFLLLTDEGFEVEELRKFKFIYLFGVEESDIRSYLESRKAAGHKISLDELLQAMELDGNEEDKK